MAAEKYAGKILILATESCAYPGADAVGQGHQSYPANTYILRVKAPVLFPEQFYLDCFHKGIAGIIIMSCGEECPYEGAYEALAKRIDRVYALIKLFWLREMPDIDRRFDYPPGIWFEPSNADTEGPIAGKFLERDKYDGLLQHFYDQRQWDRRGIPTRRLIQTLGLEAEAADAEKYGRLE